MLYQLPTSSTTTTSSTSILCSGHSFGARAAAALETLADYTGSNLKLPLQMTCFKEEQWPADSLESKQASQFHCTIMPVSNNTFSK